MDLHRHLSTASPKRQAGVFLLELSAALAVLGALTLGTLLLLRGQQARDDGRMAGLQLVALGEGARRYVQDHGTALRAMIPIELDCLESPWSASAAFLKAATDCTLHVDGQPAVHNAFLPTFRELRALGYVQLDDRLPFPHGNTALDRYTGQVAEARWAVVLSCHRYCSAGAPGEPDHPPIFQLVLHNTQPFFANGEPRTDYGPRLKAALLAIGPGALISPPSDSPQAAAHLRGGRMARMPNPLRGGAPDTGMPGVIASFQLVHLDARSPAPDVYRKPR